MGCDSAPIPSDTGARDTGTIDAPHIEDGGSCNLVCPAGRDCCFGADGAPHCVDLANDVTNCGVCNRDCVATRRGDSCAHDQCGCGDFEIGCTGAENSICCIGVGGVRPYCANPGLDLSDCGACGHACDSARASMCSAGHCLCGERGGQCAGTVDDLCCSDPAGAFGCVDTRTDQAHCGSCGHRCSAFEHCVGGTCAPTLVDAGA